ncbi:MAG TPA: DUF1501 domain-containing protein [Tepidisphaeraceae bacterium]|jgi:hypothetical protein|nr:DUF1501 domain-containing protein [Tepidisphaeraceae bacterium]
MLKHFANGFGMLGLANLFSTDLLASQIANPQFAAKAKRVIFLFMSGGPSHVDLFDRKPKLQAQSGKPLPFEMPKLVRTKTGNLLGSPYKFKKHGQSGIEVSELFPNVASCIDDICVVRSMVADNINHNGACLQMNTGEQAFSRPCIGSWLLYGLGSENQNLPGFVVLAPSQPAQGAPLWSASFLPAAYQGTLVSNLNDPISNLKNARFSQPIQRKQLDLLGQLNSMHQAARDEDSRLSARIQSFELAFRMQTAAPEAFDITGESEATKKLYGVGDGPTDIFGKQCLLARRLTERGVRMVQVYHTQTSKRSSCQLWDQHGGLKTELPNNCLATDRPIAGLLKDLKSRGLLDETLVVWGGEFGRTPTAEGTDGREHHPFGFTMWLAGGGIKGGMAYGATDDFGWHAVENKVHVHDLHATILHLMGLNHEKLTYRYSGRDYRLTDVFGNVVKAILA